MNLVRRSGLLLGTICAGALVAFAGCGSSDEGASADEIAAAQQQGAEEAKQQFEDQQTQDEIAEVKEKLKKLKRDQDSSSADTGSSSSGSSSVPAGSGGIPSGATSCADDVYAGPNTSCEFAFNTATNYYGSGGSTNIDVFSPVTGKNYVMNCVGSSPTVCTGGNNASVYLP